MADIESALISELAASNTAPSPDGLPPNSSPNIVYTQGREALAMAKRAWNRLGPTVTSGGSANAQTLTYSANPTALVRGQGYCFIAGATNTGPATLTVGALAAAPILIDGFPLQGGEIRAGLIVELFTDGTSFHLTSGRPLASLASALGGSMRNFLFNPLFNVQQRGAQGTYNSGTILASTSVYTLDRWYAAVGANQASVVQVSAAQFGSGGGPFACIVTRGAGQTGTGAMWIAQTFDTDIIQVLAGQQVTITVLVQANSGFSAPNVTLDLTAGTGAPTRQASFTGTSMVCTQNRVVPAGGGNVLLSATGTVPSNTRQLEFRIYWSPTGTASGDSLNIQLPRLNLGPVDLGPDLTRIYTTELPICQRFFQKSFPAAVAPAQNAGQVGGSYMPSPVGASTAIAGFIIPWMTCFRAPGPATVTIYNPSAANAQARNVSNSVDCTGTVLSIGSETNGIFNMTTPAGTVAGHAIGMHWTADAEIM